MNTPIADLVIIANQDAQHAETAIAFAQAGYNILLEKPMAPNPSDCRRIYKSVTENGKLFGVCHVLRYTPYTQKLRAIVDSGAIGDIVSIDHLEPVGHIHYSHSFIRGNWGNEGRSSFMLLAKSCHDIDWIHYFAGKKCESVSSFGNLMHFCKKNKPAGSADRCLDCSVHTQCPYSVQKIYLEPFNAGKKDWPIDVVTSDLTEQGLIDALKTGPYGKCVWATDNDVVDHQVVSMEFEGGTTANFTMIAHSQGGHRKTTIFGTKGQLYCNGDKIEHFDFLSCKTTTYDLNVVDGTILGGHGGGDYHIMKNFVAAVATGDKSKILSGPSETLESHLLVFAAETARKEHRIVNFAQEEHRL
jgi:predicted dehydrogenase